MLIVKACRKCKLTNLGTVYDPVEVKGLNGPVNKKWSNIHLNNQTGDLNISNIKSVQYGYYKVEIKTRTMVLHMKYRITGE